MAAALEAAGHGKADADDHLDSPNKTGALLRAALSLLASFSVPRPPRCHLCSHTAAAAAARCLAPPRSARSARPNAHARLACPTGDAKRPPGSGVKDRLQKSGVAISAAAGSARQSLRGLTMRRSGNPSPTKDHLKTALNVRRGVGAQRHAALPVRVMPPLGCSP